MKYETPFKDPARHPYANDHLPNVPARGHALPPAVNSGFIALVKRLTKGVFGTKGQSATGSVDGRPNQRP